MGIQDTGRGPGVLPIPLNRTVFCVLHAKMRVCDKLMKLLATEAVKNNMKDHWVRVIRQLGISSFKVHTEDDDGNTHSPTISSLIGPHCDILLRNW